MRHLLSALIILCLLHVTTYGALAELAEITNTAHSTITIPTETPHKAQ